jgi:hypothetical protein
MAWHGMAWHGMARHALRLPLLGSYEDKLSQKLSHLPPSRSDGRLLYVRRWSRENHLRSNFKTFLFFPQFLEQHQVQKLPYKRCQFARSRCFVADLCSVPVCEVFLPWPLSKRKAAQPSFSPNNWDPPDPCRQIPPSRIANVLTVWTPAFPS